MNNITLFALTGRAGSGKDTAADHLVQVHGFTRLAFADPLRDGLRAMLGLSECHFTDRDLKEAPLAPYGVSPRRMLQTLGTEWGRNLIHPHIWLMAAEARFQRLLEQGTTRIVITDCRFENEAQWVRTIGGIVVHLIRDTAPVATHASEAGLTPGITDYHIDNTRTLADLHTRLDTLVELEAA